MPFNYDAQLNYMPISQATIQGASKSPFEIAGRAMNQLNDSIDDRAFTKSLGQATTLEQLATLNPKSKQSQAQLASKLGMFNALADRDARVEQSKMFDLQRESAKQQIDEANYQNLQREQASSIMSGIGLGKGDSVNPNDNKPFSLNDLTSVRSAYPENEYVNKALTQMIDPLEKERILKMGRVNTSSNRPLYKEGEVILKDGEYKQVLYDQHNPNNVSYIPASESAFKAQSKGSGGKGASGWSVIPQEVVNTMNLDPSKSYQMSEYGQVKEVGDAPQAIKKRGEMKDGMAKQSARNVISAIDKAYDIYSSHSERGNFDSVSGLTGSAMSFLPTSDRANIEGYITTVKANIGFDKLQSMRDASPTGGALGQVSELELKQLNSAIAALDLNQHPSVIMENLAQIREQYNTIIHGGKSKPEDNRNVSKKQNDINDVTNTGVRRFNKNGRNYIDVSGFRTR